MCLTLSYPIYHLWIDESLKLSSTFRLILSPVHRLWIVNTPSLVIFNWLCLILHLWTNEYPISPCFVVMSSRPIWTTKFRVWGFLINYVQFATSGLTPRSNLFGPVRTLSSLLCLACQPWTMNLLVISNRFLNYSLLILNGFSYLTDFIIFLTSEWFQTQL